MKLKAVIFLTILFVAISLRFYKLDGIPPGVNPDEASIGYNAYSLLVTGKDHYGQPFPLVFRSLGTYLLPIYTYLTIIPVAFFGLTIFSVHIISALSSVLIILITSLLIFRIKEISIISKFLVMLFISISPWTVYFGRAGHEVTLALLFFILSIYLFIKSLSNSRWIPITLFIIGLSSYIYYADRYLSIILFPLLFLIFKDKLMKSKKHLAIGLLLMFVSQLPQLPIIQTEAFTRRITQVNYLNDRTSEKFGAKSLYILREFFSHYLEYFSPRSLFFDSDPQQARSIPNLSVFYFWMIIPFAFGVKVFLKNKSQPIFKVLLTLLLIGPIPAALTKDPFYSFRALSFLWVLTIFIALGAGYLIELIPNKMNRVILILGIVVFSLICLYTSYFVILRYERGDNYGYQYDQLIDKLVEYKDKRIVIDASRIPAAHIWIPFYGKMDPVKFQSQTKSEDKKNYYNNNNMDSETKVDNIEIRPIFWKEDIYKDGILVGDELAISHDQVKEHKLIYLFQINGLDDKVRLIVYKTNPKEKCDSDLEKGYIDPRCDIFTEL